VRRCTGGPAASGTHRGSRALPPKLSRTPVREAVARSLAALAPAGSAALSAKAIAALWPPPHQTSITGLEQFARCPFQHFLSRGLRLEPRAEHEVSTLDMGRLYHTILEQFVHELIETGRPLSELSTRDIARNLKRLSELAIPQLSEQMRMAERDRRGARRRSARELPPAVIGEQLSVGKTKLQPFLTEQWFGGHSDDSLPALELHTSDGRVVSIRGKIDRIDLLAVDGASLAVVFDYKRSIGRRLRLDEVYHGLALQLLAYLLVVADCGERLGRGRLVPGGAFYMPLLGGYARLPHPNDADEEKGYRCFRPRGIVDFDWIHELEPKGDEAGRGDVFSVFRKKDGTLGDLNRTDVVPAGQLPAVLEHTRRSMTELADRWISGDISVTPSRLGDQMPCAHCRYRAVCRMESASCEARRLPQMSRTEVLDRIVGEEGAADG
ncbi:MAG: PD-(D/E)XK nuclease family protein, partial [Phycisphaerae bacterium]